MVSLYRGLVCGHNGISARCAAEIAGTHGRRHAVPVDFLKLSLVRRRQGNQDVDGCIPHPRGHEGRKKQEKRLEENNDLPPVQQIVFLELGPYPFREQDAQGKRDDGEEVKGDFLDIAFRKVEPEEHDIPCLRIGKDMPSRDVGVDIKESSRHRQQGAEQERFRYLNVFAVFHPLIQPERRLSLGKSLDAPAGSFSPCGRAAGRIPVCLRSATFCRKYLERNGVNRYPRWIEKSSKAM